MMISLQILSDTLPLYHNPVVHSVFPSSLSRFLMFVTQTVEKFFSKEIKYLVSNKREARYVHCLRQDSPVPSPDSGQSSPHPRSKPHRPGDHGDNIKSRSQGQTDTVSSLSLFHQPQCRYVFMSVSAIPFQIFLFLSQVLLFSSLFCSLSQVEGSLWWREW